MFDCARVDEALTPWVDDELDAATRAQVDQHLAACEGCRTRADRERQVRTLLRVHRARLTATTAPDTLRARLAAAAASALTRGPRRGAFRLPMAVAATFALAVSGLALHVATGRSATVLAAQLAADHVKCHLFEHDRGSEDAAALEARLATHGFHTRVPPANDALGLRVIGVRRCLTARGTNGHILYLVAGRPVSLYFVPHRAPADRDLDVLGQQAHVWAGHNGTYVLVADHDFTDVSPVLAYLQAATR